MAGSTTELIKEKLDIVEFLRGYLNLHPAGKNLKALCPFHKEKTPSFMVSPERQSWHCFGCGVGGDIFAFLMRYENIEFGEALRILAERAGIELRRINPAEYKLTGLLYDINNVAKEFFKGELAKASLTRQYLSERGLAKKTIEEFELGWAPNEPEALSLRFLNVGFAPQDILQAGLAVKTERGLMIDRFRGRIMFPIHNHFGKVVGFTGRILPQLDTGEVGKYVNSPETPIFNKSKLLYGLWKSKNFIREAQAVFLVEGQMDFLMSWQAGVKNVAATSGTALTGDHLRALRRLTDQILLSFDNDEAGSRAGERAIDLAEASDFNVKVVLFRDAKDPAEAAAKSREYLMRGIAEATPAVRFYFEKYLLSSSHDYSKRGELKNLRIVLGKIRSMASPVEQSFWMKELSRHTGVAEKTLTEEMEKLPSASSMRDGGQERETEEETVVPRPRFRYELLSERLLAAAFAKGDFSILEKSTPYLGRDYREVADILKAGRTKSEDSRLDEIVSIVMLQSEELSEEELEILHAELLKEYVKGERQRLTLAVKRAEEKGDETELHSALEALSKL